MWQVLYDELHGHGFEILGIALDTGGRAAVESSIRPTPAELEAVPDFFGSLMGWGGEEWAARARPTYPNLIDEEHRVAELYGIENVPMAVWIDEEGRIVRPTECPGMSDYSRRADAATGYIPPEDRAALVANRRTYASALRDWVEKGADSEFVLPPEEIRRRLRRPSETDVTAALHIRVGRLLYARGDWQAAERHYREASALCPEKWNYFRQGQVLEPSLVGELNTSDEFRERRVALGGQSYHQPTDMPGMLGPPPWLRGAEEPADR